MPVRVEITNTRAMRIMTGSAVSSATEPMQFSPAVAAAAMSATNAPTQLISFAIGDDQYGVDIMAVREIKGWTEITHLPKQPDYVRGVLNLRGVIVPIDLRCRFGQGLTEATPLHIVIIVQIGAKPIGLLADRVLDIVSLDDFSNPTGAADCASLPRGISLRPSNGRRRHDRAHRSVQSFVPCRRVEAAPSSANLINGDRHAFF